ncbi:hypothetical protein CXB51_009465 [Gossypium anomalum]|uniref:Reverse transcriptase Ty1/copia-type domain-containing protein n=1 Tax=Gossypium anomalum TaxID=47600 RepID=A0A8J6D5W5_9ROSI|nr:hypothetical protein CXB51_009465 [Gossypium anomalum]
MEIDHEPVRETRPLSEIYERADVATVEPTYFEKSQAQEGRRQAMLDEMTKHNIDGTLNKLKARLIVKGFTQKYEIDYFETFAPVARLDTIRLLVIESFKVASEKDKVFKLRKALYGLKQAPRAWYDRVNTYLISLGFKRSISEPTLYVKKKDEETLLIVSLYMDNLLVTGENNDVLSDFKGKMKSMFEMSDLGEMFYFLSMEVFQTQQGIFLSQKPFALKILNIFSMQNCKVTSTSVAIGEKLTSQGDFEKVNESTYRNLDSDKTRHNVYNQSSIQADSMKLLGFADAEAKYVAAAGAVNQNNLVKEDHRRYEFTPKRSNRDQMEMEQSQEIRLVHCSSEDQLADILTKAFCVSRFNNLRAKLGVCNMQANEEY